MTPLNDMITMSRLTRNLGRFALTCFLLVALTVGSFAQEIVRETGVSAIDFVVESISIEECFGRTESITIRPCDEVWFVNARESHNHPGDLSCVKVSRLVNGETQAATFDDLSTAHLNDTSRETVVYIHGNQTDERWSVTRGMHAYKNFFLSCTSEPIRFVIWQWKSEREFPRLGKDYLFKSVRAVQLGKTLASTLGCFRDRDLTIIGYSLGVQVTLSAMLQPELAMMDGCGYRLALIAPALDSGFAFSVTSQQSCFGVVDTTKVFYNDVDRVLKLSELVSRKKSKRNYVSPKTLICSQLIPMGTLMSFEVGGEHGKRHSITRYSRTPTVQREVLTLIDSGRAIFSANSIPSPQPVVENVASDDIENVEGDMTPGFLIADPTEETTEAEYFFAS